MSTGVSQFDALLDDLQFVVVDQGTVMGAVQGIPITLTLLSADPLAIMFQFRVNPDGTETQPLKDILEGVSEENATISIEDGSAWISVYNVSRLNNSAIHLLLEQTADTIQSTDLAVPPGCLRCGEANDAELMYVEGRPTRLCANCLDDAAQERHEVESDLNRASLGATLGLPGAGIFVIAGWAAFWTVSDLVLEHFRVQVIDINAFTIPFILALLGGVGYALGWPAGATLRRSIVIGEAPRVMSILFVLSSAIGGEILYVGLYVLRLAGVFDLLVAVQLLEMVMDSYSGFWISCKLGLLVAIGLSCLLSATLRKKVRLDV